MISPAQALPSELIARPIPQWERAAMALALGKAGLAMEDVQEPGRLFWRFQTREEVLVGFGGLEIFPPDALIRSVLTVPPMRRRAFGRRMVEMLEVEAIVLKCRTAWLVTTTAEAFFAGLGYTTCSRDEAPEAIRATRQFASICPATATVMTKALR